MLSTKPPPKNVLIIHYFLSFEMNRCLSSNPLILCVCVVLCIRFNILKSLFELVNTTLSLLSFDKEVSQK